MLLPKVSVLCCNQHAPIWESPLYEPLPFFVSSLLLVLEMNHTENIYTVEISKHHKSDSYHP